MNQSGRRKSSSVSTSSVPASARKDATRKKIEQMEQEREERRKEMIQRKEARKQEQLKNLAEGNPGDIDFIGMVQEWRSKQDKLQKKGKELLPVPTNICIAVRKRPISEKEKEKLDHDSVSCYPPKVWIHAAKYKVDGITKYMTHSSFQFDHAYGENSSTEQIYCDTTLPLVDHVVSTRGRATVFCYGQTGSGKTHTMSGIQKILASDLYEQLHESEDNIEVFLAFFELYNGYIQDLLHGRKRCKLLEDGKGEVNITGLQEVPAHDPEEFLQIIENGHSLRTTQKTEANDTSSRSHAICQVFLRQSGTGKLRGKLGLVDLAGSERGCDTKSHNSQRRAESADINTSLLSLKECIRALGQKSSHIPFRGSKLTLILKDCFSPDSKTTMITTVSPGNASVDHSLNTLRYADRIKEQRTSAPGKKSSRAGNSLHSKPKPSQERLARIFGTADTKSHENSVLSSDEDVASLSNMAVESLNSVFDEEATAILPQDETVSRTKSSGMDVDSRQNQLDSNALIDSQVSATGVKHGNEEMPNHDSTEATMEEEAELRRTVQTLFVLEESLLNQHMSNIQENAEMLTQEGKLLQTVQARGLSEDEMDEYAIQLAEFLDRKESLIFEFQKKLDIFQTQLAREADLAQRVTKLTQY